MLTPADPPLKGLNPCTDRQYSRAPRSPTRVTRCDRPNDAGRLPRTENPNPAPQPRQSGRAASGRNSCRARSRDHTQQHRGKVGWHRSKEISPTRECETRTTNPTEKRKPDWTGIQAHGGLHAAPRTGAKGPSAAQAQTGTARVELADADRLEAGPMTAATWGCCLATRGLGELLTRCDVCHVHADRAAAERCGVLLGGARPSGSGSMRSGPRSTARGVVADERRERSLHGAMLLIVERNGVMEAESS